MSLHLSLRSSAVLGLLAVASAAAAAQQLQVTVTDENGVAVRSALVFLQSSSAKTALRCETDFAGRCEFQNPTAGSYQLRVEKQGFYVMSGEAVQVGQTANVDVKLSHLQEVIEVVNVVESPPAIDPAQTPSTEQLTAMDVLNVPYPATHDYRNILNFIPGVVNDVFGQPHIAGAETYQSLTVLDGFNVTQPANALLLLRVNTDAIRSLNVETSRYSAEQGKGSGGVVDIKTGIGDDHYRFTATNFVPSFQSKNGIAFDSINPRLTFSGPLRKGKIWFFEGPDGEYDNIIVTGFPNNSSQNDHPWRIGNLAKVQMNLAPGNILAASYLHNRVRDEHAGLSPFNPIPTTPVVKNSDDIVSVKDQHYFHGGELLEAGFGYVSYGLNQIPLGTEPYVVTPNTAEGNYYLSAQTQARRWQGLANLYFAPKQWHGRHELKAGVDLDRINYHPIFDRLPISYLNTSGTQVRYSAFNGLSETRQNNFEVSGYIQDRWLPTDHLLIEPSVRYDWDEIVRPSVVFSPRLAATYVLDNSGNAKLSAGVGLFYDATDLIFIARPFVGQRTDSFYDNSGNLTATVPITFSVNRNTLQAPRFVNWSLGVERKLPAAVYLKAEFIQKRGTHGFAYNLPPNVPALSGGFNLVNTREDHYDAFQISARHSFRKSYMLMGSYTRSRSRSNQVLDFNVDNPILSPQVAGPYSWDAPNRFLSWGFLPLFKSFDFAYSVEARSGFPFYVANDQQQLVQPTQFLRFPTYFSLNPFIETRFHLFKRYWAIRGGFENITGRKNPGYVNNDINSPQFLTFGAFGHRAFTTRIRLVGRK